MTTKAKSRFRVPKSYEDKRFSGKDRRPQKRSGLSGRGRPKKLSDYGIQLREKQKAKFNYGLREKKFASYVAEAGKRKGDSAVKLYEALESRLDSAVFRLGFSDSRSAGRQLVSHGHIMVNGRKVTIPSFALKAGDKVSIRPQSKEKGTFKDLDIRLKKFSTPAWLALDKEKREGEVIGAPNLDEEGLGPNLNSILEFYSR